VNPDGTNASQESEIVHLKAKLLRIKKLSASLEASLPLETSNLIERLEERMDKTL